MRYAGIDIASETHVLAIVAADGTVTVKATAFAEDDLGYQKALTLLGPPGEVLVAMEATGHYWKNLFAVLAAAGYAVAFLNPLRTHRFAGVDLERTKTDAIDALGIARFAAQKHPAITPLPDALAEELRERVQLRQRLLQDFGDRVRQLHRLVDLGFPEFTRYVRTLDRDLDGKLREHEVGRLLTSIDGIGPQTAARVIATVGNPARFRSALAAYVGAIPALKQSGKRQPLRGSHTSIGNAQLRAALWMPTPSAVRCNPWLRAHYQRLIGHGKLPKVALLACMHKLLLATYSAAKHGQPFVPRHQPPHDTT